jgi:hypothetical protein
MAKKLMDISCSVITRNQSLNEYQNHKKYKDFTRKYNNEGKRKDLLTLRQNLSIYTPNSSIFFNTKLKNLSQMTENTRECATGDHAYMQPRYQ